MNHEPDKALRWARERAISYTNPELSADIRQGLYDHDFGIAEKAHGYRAGQAAAEARIKELEVDVITYSGMHRQAADEAISLAIKVEQAKTIEQWKWQRQRIEELEAILRDLFENPDFQVMIGGNPNMVEGLMARGRAALKGTDA